jgi:hypothetical protein
MKRAAAPILVLTGLLAAPSPPPAPVRVVHVIVSLADNRYQRIVPVPAAIGNGDDAGRDLRTVRRPACPPPTEC